MKRLLLALGFLFVIASPSWAFIRGDVDGSEVVDVGDAISLLAVLFQPGTPPFECADAADTNDDGNVDLGDAVYLLAALFQVGAPAIPPPHPADGVDPTPDALPPCDAQGLLPFTTLSQGETSGIGVATQEVITEEIEWIAFWTEHSSDPIPAVDFPDEMVIVVLGIYDNAGNSYNIDEIEDLGSTLEIRYTLTFPGAYFPLVTQPHHFVKCASVSATPVFIETIIALP